MSLVMGIDPSLRSTGIAFRRDNEVVSFRVCPTKLSGLKRLQVIRDEVSRFITFASPDIVCIEGYALGFRGASNTLFGLGELGGVLRLMIAERGLPQVVVPPTSLKLYATGSGSAKKDAMRSALLEQHNIVLRNDDQVDAVWLMFLGESYCSRLHLPRIRTGSHRHKAVAGCELLSRV